jgi:hypothetical protein
MNIIYTDIVHCSGNIYLFLFNPLKPSGKLYVTPALIMNKAAFFIYGFRMILSVNGDYFLKPR